MCHLLELIAISRPSSVSGMAQAIRFRDIYWLRLTVKRVDAIAIPRRAETGFSTGGHLDQTAL